MNNKFPIIGIVTGNNGYESFVGWKIDGTSPLEFDNDDNLVIVEYKDEENEDEKMLNSIQECLEIFFDKCDYDEKCISKEDLFNWIEKKEKRIIETWWVARDEDGVLYRYDQKPKREDDRGRFFIGSFDGFYYEIDGNRFPEITWENSPKEIRMTMEIISD